MNEFLESALAGQLTYAQEQDRKRAWRTGSDLDGYCHVLPGLNSDLTNLARFPTSNNRVLDIGSGQCIASVSMAKEYPELDITATILTPEIVIPESYQLPNLTVTQCMVEQLSVAGTYALVTSVYGAYYSEHPELTTHEIDRVTMPGGIIHLTLGRKMFAYIDFFSSLGYTDMVPQMHTGALRITKPNSNVNPS